MGHEQLQSHALETAPMLTNVSNPAVILPTMLPAFGSRQRASSARNQAADLEDGVIP